jgi:hypothetical protein
MVNDSQECAPATNRLKHVGFRTLSPAEEENFRHWARSVITTYVSVIFVAGLVLLFVHQTTKFEQLSSAGGASGFAKASLSSPYLRAAFVQALRINWP